MSSGDPVLQILRVIPPATSAAYPSVVNGASSPAERVPVWTFPDSGATYLDFLVALNGYDGGGLTLRLLTGAAAAANNYVFQAAFRRLQDDAEDLDTTAFTYDFNTVTIAAPSAVGEQSYDNITFTDGADMDSLGDLEYAILRLLRDPANGSDNLGNTAYLYGLMGYET
jgi:hypothetical protein